MYSFWKLEDHGPSDAMIARNNIPNPIRECHLLTQKPTSSTIARPTNAPREQGRHKFHMITSKFFPFPLDQEKFFEDTTPSRVDSAIVDRIVGVRGFGGTIGGGRGRPVPSAQMTGPKARRFCKRPVFTHLCSFETSTWDHSFIWHQATTLPKPIFLT